MMLLADYDASLANNNKPFYTQSTFEMDGISNGLMSLEAMVGNRAAMFRGGVMRVQGEEKVLGVFSDIKDNEGFEGDMRDLLGKRLELTLSGALPGLMVDDNKFQKDFGFTQEELPLVKSMLTQALHPDNKANFRKSPLLTFPYGQELQNLIGSVVETIIEDPVLKIKIKKQLPMAIMSHHRAAMGNRSIIRKWWRKIEPWILMKRNNKTFLLPRTAKKTAKDWGLND